MEQCVDLTFARRSAFGFCNYKRHSPPSFGYRSNRVGFLHIVSQSREVLEYNPACSYDLSSSVAPTLALRLRFFTIRLKFDRCGRSRSQIGPYLILHVKISCNNSNTMFGMFAFVARHGEIIAARQVIPLQKLAMHCGIANNRRHKRDYLPYQYASRLYSWWRQLSVGRTF